MVLLLIHIVPYYHNRKWFTTAYNLCLSRFSSASSSKYVFIPSSGRLLTHLRFLGYYVSYVVWKFWYNFVVVIIFQCKKELSSKITSITNRQTRVVNYILISSLTETSIYMFQIKISYYLKLLLFSVIFSRNYYYGLAIDKWDRPTYLLDSLSFTPLSAYLYHTQLNHPTSSN